MIIVELHANYNYITLPSQYFRENIVTMLGECSFFENLQRLFYPSKISDYECDDSYHL